MPIYKASNRGTDGHIIPSRNTDDLILSSDPYYQNTVLSLNGSAISDGSPINNTLTNNGGVTSTNNQRFISNALSFNGAQNLSVATSTNFDLGTTYTIEFWACPNALAGNMGVILRGLYVSGTWNGLCYSVRWLTSPALRFYFYGTSAANEQNVDVASGMTIGKWDHWAMVRNGTNGTVYKNGVQAGTIASLNTNAVSTQPVLVGLWQYQNPGTFNEFFNGYLDDLRITKGIARYTGTFTPPQNITIA